jgi:hypothetical protein
MVVFYEEAGVISRSRGFHSPLPISKTARGWIVLTNRRVFVPLVGTVSIINYSIHGGNPEVLSLWLDPFRIFSEGKLCRPSCCDASSSRPSDFLSGVPLNSFEHAQSRSYQSYGSMEERGRGIQSPLHYGQSRPTAVRNSFETYELIPRKKSGDVEDEDFELI